MINLFPISTTRVSFIFFRLLPYSPRVTIEYVYVHAPSCAVFVLQRLISLPFPASLPLSQKARLRDLRRSAPAWCLFARDDQLRRPCCRVALDTALKSPSSRGTDRHLLFRRGKTRPSAQIDPRLLLRSALRRSGYFGAVLARGIPLVTAAMSQSRPAQISHRLKNVRLRSPRSTPLK
jgi:hypothetical protein